MKKNENLNKFQKAFDRLKQQWNEEPKTVPQVIYRKGKLLGFNLLDTAVCLCRTGCIYDDPVLFSVRHVYACSSAASPVIAGAFDHGIGAFCAAILPHIHDGYHQ